MTQKDKIKEAMLFAMRIKSIARNILSEGNDYDMQWHKSYVKRLNAACEDILEKLK